MCTNRTFDQGVVVRASAIIHTCQHTHALQGRGKVIAMDNL
jgi:hypothetical protein